MARQPVVPNMTQHPFVKSPLQLEQWAAYEALTSKHEVERKARVEATDAIAVLIGHSERWQQSQRIRDYVGSTMSMLPPDAGPNAVSAAEKWQAWALGIADERDPSLAQVQQFLACDQGSEGSTALYE